MHCSLQLPDTLRPIPSLHFIPFRSTKGKEDSVFGWPVRLCFSFRPIWLQRAFAFCMWLQTVLLWVQKLLIRWSYVINKAKPKTQRCVVSIFAHAQCRAHLPDIPTVKKQEIKRGLCIHLCRYFVLLLTLTSKSVNVGLGQTFLNCVSERF